MEPAPQPDARLIRAVEQAIRQKLEARAGLVVAGI